VELQLELICDGERVKRERDIEDVLGELPKTLAASYAQILERIEKLPPSSLRITKNSLAWILCAKRQLTIVELLAAASMDAGGHRDQIQESDLLHYCFNMILADHNTDCFRVAHPSVRDFLVLCPQFMDRPINSMATERCMGTFRFSADMDAREPEKDDPFFDYSTTFLSTHLEEIWTEEMEDVPENSIFQEFFGSTGQALTSPAFDLWIKAIARPAHFGKKEHVELLSLVEGHKRAEPSRDLRLGKRSMIFVSSHFGLLSLLSRALRGETEPLRRNCNDQTAFSLACQRQNINTAKLILSQTSETSLTAHGLKKIDLNHPFHNKAWIELHPKIKKWADDLTMKSQWLESEGTLGNPIIIILDHEMRSAVARNRLKTVKWLLDEGASVDAFWGRPYEGSVLQHAVEHGNIKMVELLVNAGADILFPTLDWHFRNPVDAAAYEGNKAVISILLGGQPIEILDQALIEIAHFRYRETITDAPSPYLPALKMALSMSPSQGALDQAFILAASSGSEVEVELLIHKGANAQYKYDSMVSALRAAVMANNQRVIKLLVGKFHCAVDEDYTNEDNATLLEEAIDVGDPELFKLLFELGATVSLKLLEKAIFADKLLYREADDPDNGWFVRYLVEKHPEYSNRAKTDPDWLAGLLLQTLNHSNDRESNTTGAGSPAVVESLLGMGADVNYSSSSPIRIAIEKYDEDMCRLLLRHGANIYGLDANFLHIVAHRPETARMSGGVANNLRGKSRWRFATADLMELLLSRGLDPWGSSPDGIPIQIAIRECGPNWRESGKSGHDNKFSVLRQWFLEPRRNLDVDFADDRTLYYADHISKKNIRANSWNGYPVSWLHGKTVTGHSILYDIEAKIVIWRESQTRHGWADVKGEEGKQYFIAPDSGVEITIGDFELIPPEMPASGGQEWLPGFYYGGISSA
jgi:ankyrin repeat protein